MSENPWHVESIQDFAFLNCPECAFKTKEEGYFQVIFFQQISKQRLVLPLWWSFVDVSQQGLDFSKKNE